MLVTVHRAEGQTAKQLIDIFTELAGGVRPRTTAGRLGVVVDGELAYRYLAGLYQPAPEPVAEQAPEPATVAQTPAKKAAAKAAKAAPKAQPKAAVKAAAVKEGE